MKIAAGWWKPHPLDPEWDICTVCGIGTHRRQITMEWVEEDCYNYCPHCGARLYDWEERDKYTVTTDNGTIQYQPMDWSEYDDDL